MQSKILVWDNDGTVMGTNNLNDITKVILPNVEEVMRQETAK